MTRGKAFDNFAFTHPPHLSLVSTPAVIELVGSITRLILPNQDSSIKVVSARPLVLNIVT